MTHPASLMNRSTGLWNCRPVLFASADWDRISRQTHRGTGSRQRSGAKSLDPRGNFRHQSLCRAGRGHLQHARLGLPGSGRIRLVHARAMASDPKMTGVPSKPANNRRQLLCYCREANTAWAGTKVPAARQKPSCFTTLYLATPHPTVIGQCLRDRMIRSVLFKYTVRARPSPLGSTPTDNMGLALCHRIACILP